MPKYRITYADSSSDYLSSSSLARAAISADTKGLKIVSVLEVSNDGIAAIAAIEGVSVDLSRLEPSGDGHCKTRRKYATRTGRVVLTVNLSRLRLIAERALVNKSGQSVLQAGAFTFKRDKYIDVPVEGSSVKTGTS